MDGWGPSFLLSLSDFSRFIPPHLPEEDSDGSLGPMFLVGPWPRPEAHQPWEWSWKWGQQWGGDDSSHLTSELQGRVKGNLRRWHPNPTFLMPSITNSLQQQLLKKPKMPRRMRVALMLNPEESQTHVWGFSFQGNWTCVGNGQLLWDLLLWPGGCRTEGQGRRSPLWQSLRWRYLHTLQHEQAPDTKLQVSNSATHSLLSAWEKPRSFISSCFLLSHLQPTMLWETLSLTWIWAGGIPTQAYSEVKRQQHKERLSRVRPL